MNKLLVLISLFFTASAWGQSLSPPDRSQTKLTQPTISAEFNRQVNSARIWVDGKEFTRYARTNGNRVTLVPPYPLDYGVHQVQVNTNAGQRADWSFAIGNGNQVGWDDNGKKYKYKKAKKQKDKHDKHDKHDDDDHGNNGRQNNGRYNGDYRYNNGVIDASRYGPPIGSVVTVPNPPISVAFNGTVQNLRMTVDGRDVTREAMIGNEGISWVPRSSLSRGRHSAAVSGNAPNGQPVTGSWYFFVQY